MHLWTAEPFLNAVFDLLVWGPSSMSKLIEFSPDISRRFNHRVQQMESNEITGKRIKNMKFVKPRYNSAVCPLGRSILFMEAEIGLSVELSVVRSGDAPARVSQHFLAEINAEKYVQAGMMADAGDEGEKAVMAGLKCLDIDEDSGLG